MNSAFFRTDRGKSLLTGAGLAFSLGWLWFPWLNATWLPGLLWGSAGSGGGLAFWLILALGFAAGGRCAARLAVPRDGERWLTILMRGQARRLWHGSAYLLLGAALFLCINGAAVLPGLWPYFALPAAAIAYIPIGLYWGGRLLAMPPSHAAPTFFVTVALSALTGQALAFLPANVSWLLWPHSLWLAWGLSEWLHRLEIPPPRSRGRPPKKIEPDGEPRLIFLAVSEPIKESRRVWGGLVLFLATLSFIDGSSWTLHGSFLTALPIWLSGMVYAVGALLPVWLLRFSATPSRRGLIVACGLTLLALTTAAFAIPWPSAGMAFTALSEGAVLGVSLTLLAGAKFEDGEAVARAGIAFGICVASMNMGWLAGEWSSKATGMNLSALPALAAGGVFAVPAFMAGRKKQRNTENAANNGSAARRRAADGGESSQYDPSMFTEDDLKLIALLAQTELTNQEIADRLFRSRETIRYHLKKLYTKTKTSTRAELVLFATPYLMKYNPTTLDQ